MSTTPNAAAGVTVIGPDQKKYQFPKGTTEDQAAAYFKKKGIGSQPSDILKSMKAPQPESNAEIGKAAVTGVKEFGQGLYGLGKDIVQNPNWVFGKESVFQHMVTDPAARQALEANAAFKLHQYDRAGIHEIAGMLPIVGPWVGEAYEDAITSGKPWSALAKFESQALAGEAMGKAVKMVKKSVTPEALRTKAGQLEIQATGTDVKEKALTKQEMAQAGQAMADARVIGTKATLPRKLDQLVKAKSAQVDAAVNAAGVGRTADVTQSLDTAVDIAKQRAAVLGDRKALDDLDRWKQQQSSFLNPQTKQSSPRNMKAVTAAYLLSDSRRLGQDIKWDGKPAPSHIENAAKMYRKALNDHLDNVAPGTAKLRSEEAQLIENRDAAKEQARKTFEGVMSTMRGIYRSVGTIGAYAFLKEMGMSWMGAIAPVIGLKAMWDSTLSRTTRAALLSWTADLMEGKRQSAASRGGQPPQPSVGMSMVPTSPGPVPTPSGNPQATFQAVIIARQQLGPSAPIGRVMAEAQKIKATMALQAAVGVPSTGMASSVSEAPTGQPNAANPLQGNGLQANGPQVTKVAEGVSGIGPKAKALLDRLDELTQRQPKSGKDRQDIAREIEEIKKAASQGTSDAEKKAINKRVVDRERQQRHRAKAASETPGASSVGASEPTAGGDPEQHTMLIQQGLAKLSEYGELGRTTAKALTQDAKRRKWTPAEQMSQIAEAIEFLKTHPESSSESTK